MKKPVDYSEEIRRRYRFENSDISVCRTVTFVVTEDCPFCCVYCYEGCKSKKYMTFDTAKEIIDLLFRMSDTDDSTFKASQQNPSHSSMSDQVLSTYRSH